MGATALQRISGQNGSKRYDTSTVTGLNVTSFFVRSDTTFTVISGKGPDNQDINFLTDSVASLGLTGLTSTANDFYCVKDGYVINNITLAGSIIVY